MRIRILGGWHVEHAGVELDVTGAMQRALLFRLALDPSAALGYRAIAEDVWPDDPPENARAALQSLVSRLRAQLPDGVLESAPGGYRLDVSRGAVDVVRFQDLVAEAMAATDADDRARLAREALEAWTGPPWTPGDGYDWLERAVSDDRATAQRLATGSERSSAPAEPSVPLSLTELIGRETELAQLDEQLGRSRLVTVLGPGGAGKTRLAIEAARVRRAAYFVELAPVGPDEIWQSILATTGRDVRAVESTAGVTGSARDRAISALRGGDALLVLDNCEHLVDAAADAAHRLLEGAPRLTILATSREPLGIPGEAFVPLGPLAPDAAARLFDERVQSARGRALEPDEEDAAARIRLRLDGLPLALELAAAKARTMTIDEIADGLDDRFSLLSGGLRTVLPRHQTLRALVDWSWSLLDAMERTALMTLSIYPGGIAIADAAAVARAHGGSAPGFDSLVEKSLAQRIGGRYRALETIREYGLEKLAESGELAGQRRIQARRLLDGAREQDRRIRTRDIHDALGWFDAEADNIVSAIRFAIGDGDDAEAVGLVACTAWYWVIRDRNEDARTWMAAVWPLAVDRSNEDALLVRSVSLMVDSFGGFRDSVSPRSDVDTEMEFIRTASAGTSNELLQLVPLLMEVFRAAMTEENWPITAKIPNDGEADVAPWGRAMLAAMRAAMAQNRGDVEALGEASELANDLFSEIGDLWGLALARQMRAEWLNLSRRYEEALVMSDSSTEAMRTITSSWDLQQQQGLAVELLLKMGRIGEAQERADLLVREALATNSPRALAMAYSTAAGTALQLGDRDRAAAMIDARDAAAADWGGLPVQLESTGRLLHSGLALLDGDDVTAEAELRAAAETAAASHDRPIMAMVAVGIARLGASRGQYDDAERALEVAAMLRGTEDPDAPEVKAVRAAIEKAARPALEESGRAADREGAVDELTQILRR